jgi:probable rRNA maturation factor
MTYVVEVALEAGRIPLSRQRIVDAVEAVLRAERERTATITVTFVTTRAIMKLNVAHFDRLAPTDVISLGWRVPETGALSGDIYIAPEVARDNARSERTGVREELLRLVIHGVLHVIGYDHPEGEARTRSPMWRRQERLVDRLLRSAS